MRDPNRIPKMIELLRAAWLSAPDQRLGQLIFNLSIPQDSFYIEDRNLELRLKQFIETGSFD